MNKINLVIIGAVFFVLTISCSSIMKGKELAEPAVERFHSQYNAKQFTEIYNQTSDEFKESASLQQWLELLEAVHRKLGNVVKATPTNWKVNSTTAGTFATITYEVEFAQGKGIEQFVFYIVDEKAFLHNYNINSPTLITK